MSNRVRRSFARFDNQASRVNGERRDVNTISSHNSFFVVNRDNQRRSHAQMCSRSSRRRRFYFFVSDRLIGRATLSTIVVDAIAATRRVAISLCQHLARARSRAHCPHSPTFNFAFFAARMLDFVWLSFARSLKRVRVPLERRRQDA